MGCGNSKNAIGMAATPRGDGVAPVEQPLGRPSRPSSKTISVKSAKDIELRSQSSTPVGRRRGLLGLIKQNSWTGSHESLGGMSTTSSTAGPRGGSATSKVSHHSSDSGFADNDLSHFVTEHSEAEKVRAVEQGFNDPGDLDMGVVGKSCPQRLSAKDATRLEEQRVMASLRDEGLIQRPVSRAAGGMALAFELVADSGDQPSRKPPVRLAKLEKRKKRQRTLTAEQLQEKLERAEERRKQQEQQRVERIAQIAQKSDVQNALDSFATMQKSKDDEGKTKVDTALENREKKLNEMREKLRAKREHAESVRQRRKMAPRASTDGPSVRDSRRFDEDAPIVSASIAAEQ